MKTFVLATLLSLSSVSAQAQSCIYPTLENPKSYVYKNCYVSSDALSDFVATTEMTLDLPSRKSYPHYNRYKKSYHRNIWLNFARDVRDANGEIAFKKGQRIHLEIFNKVNESGFYMYRTSDGTIEANGPGSIYRGMTYPSHNIGLLRANGTKIVQLSCPHEDSEPACPDRIWDEGKIIAAPLIDSPLVAREILIPTGNEDRIVALKRLLARASTPVVNPDGLTNFLRVDGKIISLLGFEESEMACRHFGLELPTARQLALEAVKSGASLVELPAYEANDRYYLDGYREIQDGTGDTFAYFKSNYSRPVGAAGQLWLWARGPSNSFTPVAFHGFTGALHKHLNRHSGSTGVRCSSN